MVGSTEPQEGAPSARATQADQASGVPSCDSPELAAIKRRYRDNSWLDGADVDAILRMVDELTAHATKLGNDWLRVSCDLVKERDDLRAKLAATEHALTGWLESANTQAKRANELEAKLAEAEKRCDSLNEQRKAFCAANQEHYDKWYAAEKRAEAAEARCKRWEQVAGTGKKIGE